MTVKSKTLCLLGIHDWMLWRTHEEQRTGTTSPFQRDTVSSRNCKACGKHQSYRQHNHWEAH